MNLASVLIGFHLRFINNKTTSSHNKTYEAKQHSDDFGMYCQFETDLVGQKSNNQRIENIHKFVQLWCSQFPHLLCKNIRIGIGTSIQTWNIAMLGCHPFELTIIIEDLRLFFWIFHKQFSIRDPNSNKLPIGKANKNKIKYFSFGTHPTIVIF